MSSTSHSHLVLLLQGALADGGSYWAYLRMPAVKAKAFKQAQESGTLRLEEFGEVLEWGKGERVPPATMERMEREHGVNHRFEAQAGKARRS